MTEPSSPSELVSTVTLTPCSSVTVPGWTAMFASSTTIGNWREEREREGESARERERGRECKGERARERERKRGRERYKLESIS